MAATLITGISELWTFDPALEDPSAPPRGMSDGQLLSDAAVVIDSGHIAWIGPAPEAPAADDQVDLGGRAVLPGWVDSHTHLVFAGDRSAEFEARMAGESYAAGGIAVTTGATRAARDEELLALVSSRITEAVRGGTTCLETKTGYGLTVDEEARAARLLAQLHTAGEIDEITYLGAHLVPGEFEGRGEEYVDLVAGPMLEAVQDAAGPEIGRAHV